MTQEITVPYVPLAKRVVNRFLKMFVLGGLSALTVQMSTTPLPTSMVELKQWYPVLVIAFLTGGLSAWEKAAKEW